MIRIILSVCILFFLVENIQGQTLTQEQKITEKYKVDLQALAEKETTEKLQQETEFNQLTNTILPFSEKITFQEELAHLKNHKANIEQYIKDLTKENHNNSLTPMIKKYEKALEDCDKKIAKLLALSKD